MPADGRTSRPSRTTSRRAPSQKDRPDERIGQVLGSYRLQEVIGKGGMGKVYLAEHVKLGRRVALKLLRPEYAMKRDAVTRFFQEAKAVNKIRHRNIVDVTDFIELDDGTTFIIMELLEGVSLGELQRNSTELAVVRLLRLLVQVCDALVAAHAVGIVHRDLKPDNIFLCPEGAGELVKLLDFGVAKLLSPNEDTAESAPKTAVGAVVGTPAYMSPEQAGGSMVDGRSDIYALGAIMYELFCGRPLFTGRTFGDFVLKHIGEAPVPPSAIPGGHAISPTLEHMILRCLEKRPDDRYSTVSELRAGLVAELSLYGVASDPAVPVAPARRASTPPESLLPADPAASGRRSRRSTLAPPATVTPTPGLLPVAYETAMAIGDVPSPEGAHPDEGGTSRRVRTIAMVGVVAVVAGTAAYLLPLGPGRPPAPIEPPRVTTIPQVTSLAPVPGPRAERPDKVTVTLHSDPTAAVVTFFGSDQPICLRTPCSIDVDPDDGGAPDHRVFVVSKDGYEDEMVNVSLTETARVDRLVTLVRGHGVEPPVEVPVPVRDDPPVKVVPTKVAPAKTPVKTAPTTRRIDRAPAPARRDRRRDERIDESELLDPFKRR